MDVEPTTDPFRRSAHSGPLVTDEVFGGHGLWFPEDVYVDGDDDRHATDL